MELSTAILCGLVVKTPAFRVKHTWFKPIRWRPLTFNGFLAPNSYDIESLGNYLCKSKLFSDFLCICVPQWAKGTL